MRLDDVVPRPQHVTRQARWIAAPPEVVWDALHAVRLSGLPVTLVLSAARFLPVVLSGRGLGQLHDRPFLDALPVPLLASEPPTSVVAGGLLQPWHLTGGESGPALDAAQLRAWDEPGWVVAAVDFRLTPRGNGTELASETRVRATDDASRRAFARYWRLIRPGSSAVRWEVLTAVELRATGRLR
ncbi:hypothetical protein JKP75_18685 [Blastococcus sp. TML/M2B]|uniref:hypothetical protein n=1 Tax=unclassified Blastococcus TaxID=2619396 RepID=UPI00190AC15C|nr:MULTISPECIES: hypothetical protein [unclassified Blastococcus]MBN1094391.1 hypothetical protein [Blastococcus sp. TML/M2B]MBN1095352.1 hypothetical protein [Blastococcus sp. TML/C7B]